MLGDRDDKLSVHILRQQTNKSVPTSVCRYESSDAIDCDSVLWKVAVRHSAQLAARSDTNHISFACQNNEYYVSFSFDHNVK